MLLIVTSTDDRLFRFINIDDLKRSWTSQKKFLVNFSKFLDAAHIATKWLEIDQDNQRMKFLALNVDFSS